MKGDEENENANVIYIIDSVGNMIEEMHPEEHNNHDMGSSKTVLERTTNNGDTGWVHSHIHMSPAMQAVVIQAICRM
jgi:hypothetical protein